MPEFNILALRERDIHGEFRPVIEYYMLRLFEYEQALSGQVQHSVKPDEVKRRIAILATQINRGYVAVPKNEDGQTAGILLSKQTEGGALDILYVNEGYRNIGLGEQLLERLQSDNPNTQLEVEVGKVNYNAIRFYERLGFVFGEGSDPRVFKGIRETTNPL